MKEWVKSSILGYLIAAGIIFVPGTIMSYIMTAWPERFDQIAMNLVFSLILALPIGIVHGIVMYRKRKRISGV
ncbi:hypothetical protein KY348_02485 [Candidatus Woesearchaeota archaeon]|nr:hypothetical protein [Candidatus Woesearchaeota archaeon]